MKPAAELRFRDRVAFAIDPFDWRLIGVEIGRVSGNLTLAFLCFYVTFRCVFRIPIRRITRGE